MAKCAIPDCDSEAVRREWCNKHYRRWLLTTKPPCSVEGCDLPQLALGWCHLHHQRWNLYGDIHRGRNAPGYGSVHNRLGAERGPAKGYSCVDCGGQAEHWSYKGGAEDEQRSPDGRPFSLVLDNYEPRCVPCHWRHDHGS